MEPSGPDSTRMQNLADAGCDDETVRCYCALESCSDKKPLVRRQQIRLLRKYRTELLEELHCCQDKLSCLDYLLYQLKDEQDSEEGKP